MSQETFDAYTDSQLKVLSEISAISKSLEIEFWLRGGWAIDFLLGKITRPHDDIDLVTWIQNREQFENALAQAGYERIPVSKEFRNRQSDFLKDNIKVTFVYITHSVNGSIIMNGLLEWIWRADSLLPQSFMLHGISAKVLNPKQLLEEKEVYEQIGRKTRQKDIESKKVLQYIITHLK